MQESAESAVFHPSLFPAFTCGNQKGRNSNTTGHSKISLLNWGFGMITESPQGLNNILNAMQRDIENSNFEHALSKLEFIENGILRSSLRDKINHCTSIARALDKVSLLIGKEKMVEALALLQETTIPEDLDFLLRRAIHLRKLIDSYGSGVPVARESPPAVVPVCDRGAPVVYASPPPPVAVPVRSSQAPVAYESLVAGISSVVAAPSVMTAEDKKADERVRCPVCHKAIQAIEVKDKSQSLRCPMCGYTSKREFFFGSTQKPIAQRMEPKLDGVRIRGIYGDPKHRIKNAPICFLLCLISHALAYFHTDDDIYKMYSTVAMAAIIGFYLIFLRYKLFAVSMALVLAIFDAIAFAQNAIQAELFVMTPLPLLGFSLIRMIVLLLLLRLYLALLQLRRLKN